jgi:hypothetical protein
MRIRFIAAAIAGIVFATLGWTQEDAAPAGPPPAGPLLQTPPEFARWTVAFTREKPPQTAAEERAKVITTKTRDIVREEMIDIRGCRDDRWHVRGTQFDKPHGQSTWFQSSAADNPYGNTGTAFSPLPANGFRQWEWISAETYRGLVEVDGMECLVFAPAPVKNGRLRPEDLPLLPALALVSEKTRLPVLMRAGGVTQKFAFETPPTAVQSLPEDLLQQIRTAAEARERLFQPAARPY